ncbi:hypothetical protein like AT3G25590 [Hibiscus trionum]|uniref:Micronuclear linker histone polyprotein-like protein n=1 Tax=Hibiscus trionum TaxID=183268 RepID=A0A9W7JHX0_HIBTR|nr:hypothetical protein like AT3G25590 [Hibiscus trionum]
MKERGKAVEIYNNIDFFQDYTTSSDVVPCRKHPQSSSGVCAYCLKDRLINLVCSDCGEQRLSSCSCSEIATNPRNSCTGGDVGSVGRVSFLIENENKEQLVPSPKAKRSSSGNNTKSEDVLLLKRSNSSCVEIKKKNGFWRIGRFFKKKRDKETNCGKSVCGVDEKSDLWVVDYMGVSRSRSLCSFRAGGFFGSEDGSDLMNFSGARSSISAARSSGVNGGLLFDPERKSGFSEAEPRRSGFDSERRDSTFMESDIADIRAIRKSGVAGGVMDVDGGFSGANRRMFSLKESYFNGGDDSGFIDLKFDFQAESKGDIPSMKKSVLSGFGSMREGGEFMPYKSSGSIENALPMSGNGASLSNGSSYQMAMDERGLKKNKRIFKGWRWIFKAPSKLDQSREEK